MKGTVAAVGTHVTFIGTSGGQTGGLHQASELGARVSIRTVIRVRHDQVESHSCDPQSSREVLGSELSSLGFASMKSHEFPFASKKRLWVRDAAEGSVHLVGD